MAGKREIFTCDCETDPFEHGAEIKPFLWGLYNGKDFWTFRTTREFVSFVQRQRIVLYAHNGGKFDFMFLLPYLSETKAQIINGRIVAMFLGNAELRDSYAIVPVALKEIQKKEIEMWKMKREFRDTYADEIASYNRFDCVSLWEIVTEYRRVAGVHKTIASNALTFAKKKGINIGRTSHAFDNQYRKWFFGGRTECFRPGTHRNLTVLDIRSAYPFAMLHNHATGTHLIRSTKPLEEYSRDQIARMFIRLECTSRGAFPQRRKEGLCFPHEFNEFFVTGWEYLAALDCGLISDVKIYSHRSTEETIEFSSYVNHWFEYKKRHSQEQTPIQYIIGKIMMNSLYGKTAQNIANYYDYRIVPARTPVDELEGWKLYTENPVHEIHRRESLWKYKYRYGVQWTSQKLYHNVATGASITGFCRAHLLRAMHALGSEHVIYTDTDSIICDETADLSRLEIGSNLGQWKVEDQGSPVGHFAGKKLYGILLSNGKNKIACKGSRLDFERLSAIVAGKKIEWKSETPTFHLDGTYDYLARDIEMTAGRVRKKTHGAERKTSFSRSIYEQEGL